MSELIDTRKKRASDWFRQLRDGIRDRFESLEAELTGTHSDMPPGKFDVKTWDRPGGGGGAKRPATGTQPQRLR